MRFLVSGIAGDIGFGVGRIIKEWGIATDLYGIDIVDKHPGSFVFDKCHKAFPAFHKNYFEWLRSYIKKNSIDLFIPTSEAEISFISKIGINKIDGAIVLINNAFTVETCLDKLKTLTYLKKKGIRIPKNGLIGKDEPQDYPVIIKPRFGQGSKGLKIVSTKKELDLSEEGLVWQDLLLPDNQEYTCPIYSNKGNELRILIIKRYLKGGMTHSGKILFNKEIEKYLQEVVGLLDISGSINIQLRLTKKGPLLFEINPRLSGTIVFRDKIGFQDLRWWISDALGLKKNKYKPPKKNIRFYRGYTEYIK